MTGEKTEDIDRLADSSLFKMKMNELRFVRKYNLRGQNKKVTVILPTWNRDYIVGRAVESVLKQSYLNYELIISDDGSTDKTEQVLKSYLKSDQRIKYIKLEHGGVSRARNAALDIATGDYVAYLDSDNVWSPEYLLLMVNTLIDNPGKNAVYCGIRIIDNINTRKFIRLKPYDRKALINRNFIDLNVYMHTFGLFEMFGGFDESLTSLEDWELILRQTADESPCLLDCCLVDYYYEKDFNQLTFEKGLMKNYRTIRDAYPE